MALYNFQLNKIYFNNNRPDGWDEEFIDFYNNELQEFEAYNKNIIENNSNSIYSSLLKNSTEVCKSLFEIIGVSNPDPCNIDSIQEFNKRVYSKAFFGTEDGDGDLALQMAELLFTYVQNFLSTKKSPANITLNKIVNYDELKKKMQNYLININTAEEETVEAFPINMANILKNTLPKQAQRTFTITATEVSQNTNKKETILVPKGWQMHTTYLNIIAEKNITKENCKDNISDLFSFQGTEKFFSTATNIFFEELKTYLVNTANNDLKSGYFENTTKKLTSEDVVSILEKNESIFKQEIKLGLLSYGYTISVKNLAKGFYGESMTAAILRHISAAVTQIGNNKIYQLLNEKDEKGNNKLGAQTPADIIIEFLDSQKNTRKVRIQVKQWTDSFLDRINAKAETTGFGGGTLRYLPEGGQNAQRFYQEGINSPNFKTAQFLLANNQLANELKVPINNLMSGADFTHLYFGTMNIQTFNNYINQEVNANDLYSFRGRLIPGCYIIQNLKSLIEERVRDSKIKNPIILKSGEENAKSYQKRMKKYEGQEEYNNDGDNLIRSSQITLDAQIMGLKMKNFIRSIF